jgi:hypothetical protein
LRGKGSPDMSGREPEGRGKLVSLVDGPSASCPCFCCMSEYGHGILVPHVKVWCAMVAQCESWLVLRAIVAQCGSWPSILSSCITWVHSAHRGPCHCVYYLRKRHGASVRTWQSFPAVVVLFSTTRDRVGGPLAWLVLRILTPSHETYAHGRCGRTPACRVRQRLGDAEPRSDTTRLRVVPRP